jgi:hypothetical protein
MATLLYTHLPGLTQLEDSFDFRGGKIGLLSFTTFSELDRDWANSLRYSANNPVFWSATVPHKFGKAQDKALRFAADTAQFFFLSLIATTGRIIPDPQLSVSYAYAKGVGVSRWIGPAGRNLILHGNVLPPFDSAQLAHAATLAEEWIQFGLIPSSPIFRCLRSWSGIALAEPHPIVGLLPLTVALEGLLVGRQVHGVVRNMLNTIDIFCEPHIRQQYGPLLYKAYEYRSRLLHGRRITEITDASLVFEQLRMLAGIITIAIVEDARRGSVTPESLIFYLQERICSGN